MEQVKKTLNKNGYYEVKLQNNNGEWKNVEVHKLVANTFLKREEGKNNIIHINGIKTDNRVKNLKWVE